MRRPLPSNNLNSNGGQKPSFLCSTNSSKLLRVIQTLNFGLPFAICTVDLVTGHRSQGLSINGPTDSVRWIQTFFPYLLKGEKLERNTYLGEYQKSINTKSQNQLELGFGKGRECGQGVKLETIPSGISKVRRKES